MMMFETPLAPKDVGVVHRAQAAMICCDIDEDYLEGFAYLCRVRGLEIRPSGDRGSGTWRGAFAAAMVECTYPQLVAEVLKEGRARGLALTTTRQAEYLSRAMQIPNVGVDYITQCRRSRGRAAIVFDDRAKVRFAGGRMLADNDLTAEMVEGWPVVKLADRLGDESIARAVLYAAPPPGGFAQGAHIHTDAILGDGVILAILTQL